MGNSDPDSKHKGKSALLLPRSLAPSYQLEADNLSLPPCVAFLNPPDFLLISTAGATNIANTAYSTSTTPVAPGGVLVSGVTFVASSVSYLPSFHSVLSSSNLTSLSYPFVPSFPDSAITSTSFIDIINDSELARFGLQNGGAFDETLISGKWESSALASCLDPLYPNDYFLFSLSDNDFITSNGYEAGAAYSDGE